VRSNDILVAEDNEANRLLALKQLERLGCSARAVADGREAVAAVDAHPFALVLMDCNMPQLDGFAAVRAIRDAEDGTDRHTIIVAMTAGATEGDREACLAAGMDDYVCKPVMLADLQRVLGRWLEPEDAGGAGEAPAAAAGLQSVTPPPRTSSESIDQAVFDRFRDEVGGEEFAGLFVEVFLRELDGRLVGVRQARADADAETLERLAHTMKSTSATIGARRLADLSRQLEAEAHEPSGPKAGILAEDLEEEAVAVREALGRRGYEPADAAT
jgi:CheY-like chemotaxis protein/HPt (histidine-containing phosphotransfer) domain-containing protein